MARIVGWQDECGGGRLLKKCIPFSPDEGEKRVGGRNKKELFVLCIWIKRCIFASHFGNRPLALGFSLLAMPHWSTRIGEVLEWLKRHAWKACKRQKRFGGSNPPLSAWSTLKLSSEEIKEKRKYRNFNELRYFSFIRHCPSRVRREYPNTPKRLSYGYNLATLFSTK